MSSGQDPDLFDTPPEAGYDRLVGLAALAVGAPVALLSLVDSRRQFFKAMTGLSEPWADARQTPISHSFCRIVVERNATLVIDDACADARVCDNPAIDDLNVRAYLGAPVRGPSGRTLGALCVIDSRPRVWRPEDRRIVEALAASVETEIALHAASAEQARVLSEMLAIHEALSAQSAELAIARMTAERALTNQSRLLAGLSHELRTPLNGVLGGVALLGIATDDAKRARYVEMIGSAATALQDCVDDLITYCRLGTGADVIEVAPFDPAARVRAAADAVAALAAAKGLTVTVDLAPDLPTTWSGDGRRVEQILVNLLGNAIKYTDRGGVTASARRWGDAIAFRVCDTGRGVPAEHQETIFEPFNRGDPAAARSAAGTGLGLAIAREAAQRLGGSLRLERSEPGAGSTFLLLAPAIEAGDEPVVRRATG